VSENPEPAAFDDLIAANRSYAASFSLAGLAPIAQAGVAMVTCMDSRIDPLGMIGLQPGDAKILRNPGGRVTDQALVALVIGVNLLGVDRILIVQHTGCAMATATEPELRDRLSRASGEDASWMSLGVIRDQVTSIKEDVAKVRAHPLIASSVAVGGFRYDVDTGLLQPVT
jgi:carbonic anhydrase